MSTLSSMCRFCSKEQPQMCLINLETTREQRNSVRQKLRMFCEDIVDFNNKTLPETICDDCCSTLDVSHKFFMQAKEAQVVLGKIYDDNRLKENQSHCEPLKEELDSLDFDSYIDTATPETKPASTDESWSAYPWRCHHCSACLPSLQELRVHSQESHGVCCCFRCDDCDEQTVGFEEYVGHVRGHRPYLKKYCQYCNMKMEDPSHVETHTGSYNCTFCGQTFTDDTQLLSHLKKYVPKMTKNSELFEMMLDNLADVTDEEPSNVASNSKNTQNEDLNDTQSTKSDTLPIENDALCLPDDTANQSHSDSEDEEWICDLKKRKRKEKQKLKGRERKREKKKGTGIEYASWSQYPSICKFCSKEFDSKELLRKHCGRRHKKCFGAKCIDCDNDTSETLEEFVQHVREHRPYLIHICHYCDAVRRTALERHLKTHRGNHQCKTCGNNYQHQSGLYKHIKALTSKAKPKKPRQRSNPNKLYTCDICHKLVKFLQAHKRIHKHRTKDHTCDRCGQTFYTYHSMLAHSAVHNTEKKEQCKVCGKFFLTVSRLKKHVKTHNLVKPYQCDHCKKFFSAKANVRAHMVVHMDKKEIVCKFCSKRFKNRSTLRDHVRVHTGDKPYQCQRCDAKFACWASCYSHTKRIHGISIAKTARTPYGQIDLDPDTGLPSKITLTDDVAEWTKKMILERLPRQSKQDSA